MLDDSLELELKGKQEQIDQIMNGRPIQRMRLPKELEKGFIEENSRQMRVNLQENGINLLAMYVGFSVVLLLVVPFETLGVFPWIMLFLFIGLVIRIIDSHNSRFDPFTEIFSTFGGALAIVVVSYGMTTVEDPDFSMLAKFGISLFMFGHFTLLKLRLKMALMGAAFACLLSIIGSFYIAYEINWLVFSGYFLSSAVVGASVCYLIEYWARTVFLQEQLLLIENKRIESLYKKVEDMSRTDYLTGLNNRRHLNEMLEHEWSRGKRSKEVLSILFIDIDYFKQYNDFYGHEAGDIALQQVAETLKDSVKRGGDIVCRYGGEEFVLVLPDTNEEHAVEVMQKIQKHLEQKQIPHEKSQVSSFVSLSMGLYVETPGLVDEDWEDAIKKADAALYKAKAQGRNQWCVAK